MSNQPMYIWDSMVLFNQVLLRNILEGQDDLSTPEVLKAVAKMNEEQKAVALLFLNNNNEELAVLPAGWGSLAFKLVNSYWMRCQYLSPTWRLFLLLGTFTALQWK